MKERKNHGHRTAKELRPCSKCRWCIVEPAGIADGWFCGHPKISKRTLCANLMMGENRCPKGEKKKFNKLATKIWSQDLWVNHADTGKMERDDNIEIIRLALCAVDRAAYARGRMDTDLDDLKRRMDKLEAMSMAKHAHPQYDNRLDALEAERKPDKPEPDDIFRADIGASIARMDTVLDDLHRRMAALEIEMGTELPVNCHVEHRPDGFYMGPAGREKKVRPDDPVTITIDPVELAELRKDRARLNHVLASMKIIACGKDLSIYEIFDRAAIDEAMK